MRSQAGTQVRRTPGSRCRIGAFGESASKGKRVGLTQPPRSAASCSAPHTCCVGLRDRRVPRVWTVGSTARVPMGGGRLASDPREVVGSGGEREATPHGRSSHPFKGGARTRVPGGGGLYMLREREETREVAEAVWWRAGMGGVLLERTLYTSRSLASPSLLNRMSTPSLLPSPRSFSLFSPRSRLAEDLT